MYIVGPYATICLSSLRVASITRDDRTTIRWYYYTADFIVHYSNEELNLESLGDQLASATRRIGNPKLENE